MGKPNREPKVTVGKHSADTRAVHRLRRDLRGYPETRV
jgi:hypothetical protein